MTRKNRKNYHFDTAGGAYVDGDVNAGRDFIGRDKVIHIQNNYPAVKQKSSTSSSQERKIQKVENAMTESIRKLLRWLLPVIIALVLMQLLCIPMVLAIPEYTFLGLLPSVGIIVLLQYGSREIGCLPFGNSFYRLSVGQREMLMRTLQKKDWGNMVLSLYISVALKSRVEIYKPYRKRSCKGYRFW